MKFADIRRDFGPACVGALATLPQAVAYGLIAVAPLGPDWAAFGIATSVGSSILFGLITGLWGPNRFMISGPGAVTALMLASAIAAALGRGYEPSQALALAYVSIVIAGLFQVVAGWLRLGHVTSYIPVPVLSGFANASALLVMISAVPTVLGLPGLPLGDIAVANAHAINPWAVTVGGVTIVGLLVLDGRIKVVPGAVIALAVGSALYHLGTSGLGLSAAPLIGYIDLLDLWRIPPLWTAGDAWLASFGNPASPNALWRAADIPLLAGLSMGLLASFYTVICSTTLALRTDEPCDANAELRVHGVTNVLMGGLGFLPGNGSPSRSAAILDAGATSRAANYGSAIVFAVLLAAMAPLVAVLPLWATAGMLIATSLQAFDQGTLNNIKNIVMQKLPYPRVVAGDVAVTVVVIVTALAFDLIAAVGLGVFLSVALFVLGMGRNPIRRIYQGSRIHSKIHRPPEQIQRLEQEGHRIAVIEIQGALFFGSCAKLLSEAQTLLNGGVEFLILDFKHLTSLDSTGSTKLRTLSLMCKEAGGQLMISYVEPERRTARASRTQSPTPSAPPDCRRTQSAPRWIWLVLHANAITDLIGVDWFFSDTDSALARSERLLL
ncbi:SulP family inorganic anion transporter [Magnetovibrio sp.]|uniref:SulP family inorganic anion transporter n=1 Tax=Magnetovibrio sp. TaxID=2024836 RepID=UPI002F950C3A